ncbi:MAG: hypothetical protein KDD70_08160 [Bdellovibrionales bacterium]|nr:hypothetical protein [Bdellovibrionales bacterium]
MVAGIPPSVDLREKDIVFIQERLTQALTHPDTQRELIVARFDTGHHFTYVEHFSEEGEIAVTVTSFPLDDRVELTPEDKEYFASKYHRSTDPSELSLPPGPPPGVKGFLERFRFDDTSFEPIDEVAITFDPKRGVVRQSAPVDNFKIAIGRLSENRRIAPLESDFVPEEVDPFSELAFESDFEISVIPRKKAV